MKSFPRTFGIHWQLGTGRSTPPRVDSKLTSLGESLGESVCAVWLWVEAHASEVERARKGYDARAERSQTGHRAAQCEPPVHGSPHRWGGSGTNSTLDYRTGTASARKTDSCTLVAR